MRVGQKVYIVDKDGRKSPGMVTEVWPADECHSAGFRVDIHFYNRVHNAEFRDHDIGESVILAKK